MLIKLRFFIRGKVISDVDADKIWESEDPYIYQFIRGNVDGPIQREIPDDKNKM